MQEGSLVLYKNRPARVRRVGDKLEIELGKNETVQVRPKDVALLHPGPLKSLDELGPQSGEAQAAWEILAGNPTTLAELAELAYGAFTPATAWAAWQVVAEGLYFRGTPDDIIASTPEQVTHKQAARQAEADEKRAWDFFVEQVRAGRTVQDSRYLREVEALALGQSASSRLLRELGRDESPENAHALLLNLGHWDEMVNPYPQRLGVSLAPPSIPAPELPQAARVDLTHLAAFAIDDEGTQTPDDALSLEGRRLWVHVADAGALARPGSALDLDARARASSIYLPEQIVPMFSASVIERLGLGLADVSPALSFALDLDAAGQLVGTEITPSWVRVTRLTYEQAEARLEAEPFKTMNRLAQLGRQRRCENGALRLDFPEVKVTAIDGQAALCPLPPLESRALVQEAMIMAGAAAARLGLERGLPLPFATQEPPESTRQPETLSEMYALRRALKRSQYKSAPALHAGLGLEAYVQVTSPLRRYLDLVAHQQLWAYLCGEAPLGTQEVLERIGAVEGTLDSVRQAESLSGRHWTLVYLLRHPTWRGQGILVDKRGLSGRFIIPELGLEPQAHLPADWPLDSVAMLALCGVNLPQLEAHFRIESLVR